MKDLLDIQLIALLQQDATQTSRKLAEQLSVSSSTVRRRMKELIKRGVIRIIAIPTPKEIGLPFVAILAFQVSHEHINTFLNTLSRRRDVVSVYATSGRFNVIAIMWLPSPEELYKFMESEISRIEGVMITESFICLHIEKHLLVFSEYA